MKRRASIGAGARSIERRSTFKVPRAAMQRKRSERQTHDNFFSTLRQGRRKRKATIKAAVRERVLARSAGRCVCGCERWAFELHHVFPEGKFPELAKVESNLVGINPVCHARHENAFRRLRRDRLPRCVFVLAATDPRYQLYLERTYLEAS